MSTFRVATYNVHKCVGIDRRKDPVRVAAVIRELEADIIGLQEVYHRSDGTHESAQMDFQAREAGYEAVAGPTIKLPKGHYGNVLLTRWPVVKKREIDLCFTCREPRGALETILAVKRHKIRVIVTHLGLARVERRHQIAQLIEYLGEETPARLTVLVGDLNEWLPVSRGLLQIHRRLGRSPGLMSFPSWWPLLALDRIWVRPKEAIIKMSVHSTKLSRRASDHLPVVADLDAP
jgi:endonuclease/exonuclease/phosphatase family metal-dependent hydrolase